MAKPRIISPRRYQDVYGNTPKGTKAPEESIAHEQIRVPAMQTNSFWRNVRSKHIGYIFFLFIIALVYIYNSHLAEKQIRNKYVLEQSVRDLKTRYHIADAKLSMVRKQTNISEFVDTLGLKKLNRPPYKVVKGGVAK
jgi:hypothetical protein